MCAILSFVPRPTTGGNARPLEAGAAAVIIFPGVRYERPAEAGVSQPAAATRDGQVSGPAKH